MAPGAVLACIIVAEICRRATLARKTHADIAQCDLAVQVCCSEGPTDECSLCVSELFQ